MGSFGPSWRTPRSLRSLLLGGAAAVAWLALSSTAASADSGSSSEPILGGLTSSVSSVTSAAGNALSAVSAPLPALPPASGSNGLLQPVVGSLTGAVDNLAATVPVVNQVVPDHTVTNVISPVSSAVDDAAGNLAEAVIPPASETIPALEPVLNPIADVISGGEVTLPEPVAGIVTELVGEPTASIPNLLDSGAAPALPGSADSDSAAGSSNATAVSATGFTGALWQPSVSLGDTSGEAGMSAVETGPHDGNNGPPVPEALPAVPGSGSSSGQSSGASSGGAAFLTDIFLNLPQAGSTPATASLQHAPAPVSFDPGSSPD
jgi:hypothetical protein